MSKVAIESLISVLRTEVESARSEVEAIRSSVRYRLGDVMLQALPLSIKSFQIFPKVFALFYTYRRSYKGRAGSTSSGGGYTLPSSVVKCRSIVFGQKVHPTATMQNNVWFVDESALLIARLEAAPVNKLVLYDIDEPIARRLARLQLQGCYIVWSAGTTGVYEQYVNAIADDTQVEGII